MKFNHGRDHARIGRLLVTRCNQSLGAPWLDSASSGLVHDDGTVEHFGAIVVSHPASLHGVAFGWQGAFPPNLHRLRLRALYRRARWVLAGRPNATPMGVNGPVGGTSATPPHD